jgi:hypothetical protein
MHLTEKRIAGHSPENEGDPPMTRKLCIAIALLVTPAVFAAEDTKKENAATSPYACKGIVEDGEEVSSVDVLPTSESNANTMNGTLAPYQFGVVAFEEQGMLHLSIFSRADRSRSARANAIIPKKDSPSLLQMRTPTGSLELICKLK